MNVHDSGLQKGQNASAARSILDVGLQPPRSTVSPIPAVDGGVLPA